MKTINVVAAVIREGDRIFATQRGYGDYKDWWEFPGGKIEPGETSEEALIREIKEELDVDIRVGGLLDIVEYDYPEFHMIMNCYWAEVVSGSPKLLEHEAAEWLGKSDLYSVNWLPSDLDIIEKIEAELDDRNSGACHE